MVVGAAVEDGAMTVLHRSPRAGVRRPYILIQVKGKKFGLVINFMLSA
jgi:hypothetical protein